MTKPLRQNQMVVKSDIVDALPVIKKAKNGFKRFRILREIADRIVEEHERLCSMRRSLWQRKRRPSDEPLPDVEDAQLAQWVLDDVARCRALLEEIDREDRYEEDEEGDRVLKKAIVAARLALAFANARGSAKSLGETTAHELQNEIRQAHAKFEAEKADAKVKRVELDLRNRHNSVSYAKQQAIAKQEAAQKGYQEFEAAMARLVKYERELDAAAAALVEALEARNRAERNDDQHEGEVT